MPDLLLFLKTWAWLKKSCGCYDERHTEGEKEKFYLDKARSVNMVVSILILIGTVLLLLNHEVQNDLEKREQSFANGPMFSHTPSGGSTCMESKEKSVEPASSLARFNKLSHCFKEFVIYTNYFLGLLIFVFGLIAAELLDTAANPFVPQTGRPGHYKQSFFYHDAFWGIGGSGFYYGTIGLFVLLTMSIFSLLLGAVPTVIVTLIGLLFGSTYFFGYFCSSDDKTMLREGVDPKSGEWNYKASLPTTLGVFFGSIIWAIAFFFGTLLWYDLRMN